MGPDDASGCFIMEFREAKASPVNLICVIDVNQKDNVFAALVKGFSLVSADTDLKHFEEAKEGEVFEIFKWTPEGTSSHKVKIEHTMLADETSGADVLKFVDIEDQYNFPCGLEFREIKAAKDPQIEAV